MGGLGMKERMRTTAPLAACACRAADCLLVKALARAVREVAMYERARTLTMGRARIENDEAARDA